MLHAYAARFDVTENLEKILFLGKLNKAASLWSLHRSRQRSFSPATTCDALSSWG